MPVPGGVDLTDAAGLPEAAATVWSNLVMAGGAGAGQVVLVHGGAGGIGSHAIQVARALGCTVLATAGSPDRAAWCRQLGAALAVCYRDDDFVRAVAELTGDVGADVILDVMGASYLDRNLAALAPDGRLVIIGMQGGTRAELDIATLVGKRLTVFGTTLRGRPVEGENGKAAIISAVISSVWPMLAEGSVRPVTGAVFGIEEAGAAHRALAGGQIWGKAILRVADSTE
jgi:NADPH:quinone reductase-like Zn-dependent oxidoreductase